MIETQRLASQSNSSRRTAVIVFNQFGDLVRYRVIEVCD